MQDPTRYSNLVSFLDEGEGAGWELLSLMLRGGSSALELMRHKFLVHSSPIQPQPSNTNGTGGFKLPWS